MPKLIVAVVLVLAVAAAAAFFIRPQASDDPLLAERNKLVGTWQLLDTDPEATPVNYFVTYNADGTYIMKTTGTEMRGTWDVERKRAEMPVAGFVADGTFLLIEELNSGAVTYYWTFEADETSLWLYEANENGRGQHSAFVRVK